MSRAAAIYCRISRDRVGAGLGVERQEADCRELAAALGWTVVAVHIDNDISAYSGKPRPGYKALLADLESGRADAVLAWHTDRLHRSPAELETYIGVCEQAGAPTHCVKAGPLDLSTASGRMTARITGAVARHEVEHMIERQKAAKAQAAKGGRYRGGRRPFGFEADGMTVHPIEAEYVDDASQRVLRGESLSSVAREWTERRICSAAWHPPLVCQPWTSIAVRRVLLRARNAGLVELAGQEVAAAWPAIVPEQTWRALRVLCADPDRRAAKSTEARWLGSGLYRCGVCDDGTTVRAAAAHGGAAIYRCKSSAHLARAAQPVDAFVTEVVLARLSRDDARILLDTGNGTDLDALSEEAAALRVRQGELVGLFTDGVLTAVEVAEGKARLASRLTELAARMAGATAGSPLAGFADATDVRESWEAATVPRRKTVVSALMAITLSAPGQGARHFDPESVRVDWTHDRAL